MTIYKPNGMAAADRQKELLQKLGSMSDGLLPPEVVVDDTKLLLEKSKGDDVLMLTNQRLMTNTYVLRRRRALLCAMVVVSVLLLCVVAMTTGLFVYRRVRMNTWNMQCTVMYHEGEAADGRFEQSVQVDDTADVTYEKLQVPPILNFFRSTVLHDFNKNQTTIIDSEHERCYAMQLNRETVKPPKDFFDLLDKLQTGYYMPDATLVRHNYKVLLPALDNLDEFAVDVQIACADFQTYRLVPATTPATSPPTGAAGALDRQKKSVGQPEKCDMLGDGFCLGHALGVNTMECLQLVACF